MSEITSFSGKLVQNANTTLAAPESENTAMYLARIYTRGFVNLALMPIALIEAVFFEDAKYRLCTHPSRLAESRVTFREYKKRSECAARAFKSAVAGIIGRGVIATPEKVDGRFEKAKNFVRRNPVKIIAFVVVAALAYDYNTNGITYCLGKPIVDSVRTELNTVAATVYADFQKQADLARSVLEKDFDRVCTKLQGVGSWFNKTVEYVNSRLDACSSIAEPTTKLQSVGSLINNAVEQVNSTMGFCPAKSMVSTVGR